jgi:hypothetical protein
MYFIRIIIKEERIYLYITPGSFIRNQAAGADLEFA